MATITDTAMANLICQADKRIETSKIGEFVFNAKGGFIFNCQGYPVVRYISLATMCDGQEGYQATLDKISSFKIGTEVELNGVFFARVSSGWFSSSEDATPYIERSNESIPSV